MGENNELEKKIEEIFVGSQKIKDIDYSNIPTEEGLYFVFSPSDFLITFLSETTGPEEIYGNSTIIYPTLLAKHYEKTDRKTLFVGHAKNLKSTIKSFVNYGKTKTLISPKSGKVIWQIENNQELLIGYFLRSSACSFKEVFFDQYLSKYGRLPVGNQRFGTNDAVSSWSGFNYQGKVMILRVMEHINKLLERKGNIEEYKVELEKTEDFVIYKNNDAIEFYQVKARLSDKNYSAYADAIEKLLDHSKKSVGAHCYLISAVDIIDWDNTDVVKLYGYDKKKFIDLSEVITYIQNEIVKYYKINGKTLKTLEIEFMYLDICEHIHKKVTHLHQRIDTDYNILYSDITEILDRIPKKFEVNNDIRIKEKVYEYIVQDAKNGFESFCNDCKADNWNPSIHCTQCSVKLIKENFSKINIVEYAQILRPHQVKIDESFDLIKAYDTSNMKSLLKEFIYSNSEHIYLEHNHNYIQIFDDRISGKIIPTQMNFENFGGESLSEALQNIRDNELIMQLIDGTNLTAKVDDDDQIGFLEKKINFYFKERQEIIEEAYDQNTAINRPLDFKIINRNKLIQILKEKINE